MKDMPNAIYYWLEAYQFFPKRIDNLYEMIHYYRIEGKNNLAYMYYVAASQQVLANPNADYLFMKKSIYDYELDYEMSIFGFYCKQNTYDLAKISCKVLNCSYITESVRRNVLSNYKFYSKKLIQYDELCETDRLELQSIGKMRGDLNNSDFVSSTPTLVLIDNDTKLVVGTRYVNYRINEKGGYENQKHITTVNIVKGYILKNENSYVENEGGKISFELIPTEEAILGYNTELDGDPYVGVEDVRLHYTGSKLLYNGNRGLGPHSIRVEHGSVDYAGLFGGGDPIVIKTENALVYKNGGENNAVEKNWVLFQSGSQPDTTKCIYGWHPLIVGDLVEISRENGPKEYEYKTTHEMESPPLFRVFRGSTNGVAVYNRAKSRHEIWFLCHVVSYEDRRYYYHAFVALDPVTYDVLGYTTMFTFEGQKVEYSLGFVCVRDKLLIGYSVMDRETKYMCVPVNHVVSMMHEKI
jgi:hypothetical protein